MNDGIRAMSEQEMRDLALRQAAGMQNAVILSGDYMRGAQNMRNIYANEIGNRLGETDSKVSIFKRISMLFHNWLDKP